METKLGKTATPPYRVTLIPKLAAFKIEGLLVNVSVAMSVLPPTIVLGFTVNE